MSDCILKSRPPSIGDNLRDTMRGLYRRSCAALIGASALVSLSLFTEPVHAQAQPAQQQRPNIVVIMGDDIGIWNIGAYHRGMMAGRTPNLDKIAAEGMLFTDYYAEASCTAGRANFITGQLPIRTGMTTVGQAGAPSACRRRRRRSPPHFGRWATPPVSSARTTLATRTSSCRRCTASNNSSATSTISMRWKTPAIRTTRRSSGIWLVRATCFARRRPISTMRPLTRAGARSASSGSRTRANCARSAWKRWMMKSARTALKFIDKARADNKPFFLWLNPTRMHIVTHLSPKYQAMRNSKNGWSIHEAGMAQLDDDIGLVMKKLQDTGIDNNTIVIFTTDNGTEVFTWPDGGQTPFAQSKGTIMEGGFRAPAMIRWPGRVPAGKVENGLISGLDWFPTLLAAAGNANIVDELKKGKAMGDRTYKVHLDGYNQMDMITGKGPSNRNEIFYFGESELGAVRVGDFKYRFIDQPDGWLGPKVKVDVPYLTNLRLDPFERTGWPEQRDQDRGATVFRLVQVRVLALRVCPAAGREAGDDRGRVPADAEGRELQPRRREIANRSGEARAASR